MKVDILLLAINNNILYQLPIIKPLGTYIKNVLQIKKLNQTEF